MIYTSELMKGVHCYYNLLKLMLFRMLPPIDVQDHRDCRENIFDHLKQATSVRRNFSFTLRTLQASTWTHACMYV